MGKTYLWHFRDPNTEKVFACVRDEREEAEEAFRNHLASLVIVWDTEEHGELDDFIECMGRYSEVDVWEV